MVINVYHLLIIPVTHIIKDSDSSFSNLWRSQHQQEVKRVVKDELFPHGVKQTLITWPSTMTFETKADEKFWIHFKIIKMCFFNCVSSVVHSVKRDGEATNDSRHDL